MPEKCDRKGASPTESAAGQDWALSLIHIFHRFNKAQQDAFLPYVEKGSIILIGATTENPSFEINGALLSRCRVFVLRGLGEADIGTLLARALKSPKGLGYLLSLIHI